MAGRLPALQAGAGGVWPADCRRYRRVRGPGRPLKDLLRCGGRRPLRREGPVFVIASQCAHWRGNPYPRSLFPMFSNGNLKTPQLFIFHSSFFISPQAHTAGAGGVWPADCRRYRRRVRAGYGRQIAGATGRCGRGMAGRLPALQACAEPGASRRRPLRRSNVPNLSFRAQREIRVPRPLIPDP